MTAPTREPQSPDVMVVKPAAVIECRGVAKTYRTGQREVAALRGVDLDVAPGSWVAVTGASGSGKSTLLQMLGGLDRVDDGTIRVAGQAMETLSEARRAILRRRRIGYVFQFFNLVANLSVRENVELPMLLVGTKRAEARERATKLLAALGIGDLGDSPTTALSGGQQQRVAIARALANQPDVLLADEPTGNLDRANTAEVLALLRAEHERGQTIVMVTHDAHVAEAAERVLTMADGQIVGDSAADTA
ncbi:MAG TPA: ABC transporter ATP-binding protein [Acidimicrobiales bacterium]